MRTSAAFYVSVPAPQISAVHGILAVSVQVFEVVSQLVVTQVEGKDASGAEGSRQSLSRKLEALLDQVSLLSTVDCFCTYLAGPAEPA